MTSASSQGTSPTGHFPWRLGRYEVLCELATGGMAILYLARAVGPGGFERLFAIKMIHAHLGKEPRFVEMFLDEARLVARIRHPNVVPVYEVGVFENRHFICMEYISGETLGAALTSSWPKGKPFPLTLVPYVISSAAEGLHAAHELKGQNGESLGVIHRDVTPQNVMIGYDGSVRMMDFGVARARDQIALTIPGTFKGTPAYMAPEQVRGLEMDRRSDVFGLGVILWEMTVGKRLFKDKNDIATTMNVLKKDIPPPTRMMPGYPPQLEQIVMTALSRAPAGRFRSARELSEALQQFEFSFGRRSSTGELERWMKETFAERLEERRAFEHRAMDTMDLSPLLLPVELSVPMMELPSVEAADITDERFVIAVEESPAASIDDLIQNTLDSDGFGEQRPTSKWRPWVIAALAALVLAGVAIGVGAVRTPEGPQVEALNTPRAPPMTPPPPLAGASPPPVSPLPDLTPTATAAETLSTPGSDRGHDPRARRRTDRKKPKKPGEKQTWGEGQELYRGSDL